MIESQKYNLGWHRGDLKGAAKYLVYVLVPFWQGYFAGEMELEKISFSGVSLGRFKLRCVDLASPRLKGDTEGVFHPVEAILIRQLEVKARNACHTLPLIVPSITFRGWSRMTLSSAERKLLLNAGGAPCQNP